MNPKLQDAIFQDNNTHRHLSRRIHPNSNTRNGIINRFKSLFCGCFTIVHKKPETYIDHDPSEYDYVVEKLFVRRVPFGFFAIPQDILHCPKNGAEQEKDANTSTSSSDSKPTMKSRYSVMSDMSQLHQLKSETHTVALIERQRNKLHFNKDKDICNKKQKLKETDSVNAFNKLHLSLKDSESLSQQYLPFNFQGSKTSFSSFKSNASKLDIYEKNNCSDKAQNENTNISQSNIVSKEETIVTVSSDQIQDTAKNVNDLMVKAILRWKIIIKHRKSETLHSSKENEIDSLEPANNN